MKISILINLINMKIKIGPLYICTEQNTILLVYGPQLGVVKSPRFIRILLYLPVAKHGYNAVIITA